MRVLFAILGTALLALIAVTGLRAAGESEVLFVSWGSAEVGGETTVTLAVGELADPPLGAWQIDINYDNTVVTATECIGLAGSVCNPVFDEDTVRVAGASAAGLTGTNELGAITFLCDRPGESPLMLRLSIWGNAIETEQRKVELQDAAVTCTEPGQDGVIRIGSYSAEVGDEVTVVLEAVDVPPPGLGAWAADVSYDESVVSLLECEPRPGGICNLEYEDHTLRVAGASAAGLPGFALAEIVFACSRAGTTDLEVSATFYGTSFPEDPPSFPDAISGTITCTERSSVPPTELPSTGVAKPRPGSLPATVPLAVVGSVLLAAAFAFRRYASPR